VLRLRGRIDPATLTHALHRVVDRHEVLRTVFDQRDGAVVQHVQAAAEPPVDVVDLTDVDDAAASAAIEARARAEAATPFDLRTGPLIRLVLLRRADDDVVLLFVMHHIVCDQWSLGILARELAAFCSSPGAERGPLPIQYGDYAAWQQEWRTTGAFAEDLEWWRGQLAGVAATPLPADRNRRPTASFDGAAYRFVVAADTRRAVEALGQSVGATPFMTLLALFTILIARETGHADVLVGTPIANRPDAALEPLVGFFANTLVVRTRVELPA
jgi:hypothetical protein